MAEELHPSDESPERVRAEPIQSRFLFVDVSARRANQLKRGARVRLEEAEHDRATPRKLERIAMEEVRRGLVHYKAPDLPSSAA